MDEELKSRIYASVLANASLEESLLILKSYKEDGGTQRQALATLESMRTLQDEEFEDRILDLMDFVSGFCREDMKLY